MAAMETTNQTMSPVSAHLIDGDGTLMSEKDIYNFLISTIRQTRHATNGHADAPLQKIGVNYHVVGVFGGQSSGKSTLLNHLFQTKFQTMDESQRRGQTTKGAFIARTLISAQPPANGNDNNNNNNNDEDDVEAAAAGSETVLPAAESPLFILDFEGTDGIERGEDQSFERQLSLFALSVADTLIINMWAVDVGRFNGANMSLLRTIFEVNLQLFSHDSYVKEEKPTLLVLMRDFTEEDPSFHIKTVRDSFDKIWESIVKPSAYTDCTIDTLFELRYRCLPHYKLQRQEFNAAITDFRSWFLRASCADYLFADRAAMFRGVPLDGLPTYLASCWDVIRSSKDLDIPTQREMLARHRCGEVRDAMEEKFAATCQEYSSRLQRGELVPQLVSLLEQEVAVLLSEFRNETRLYAAATVREAGSELEEKLVTAELRILSQYAKTISATVVASVDAAVGAAVDGAVRWVSKESLGLALAAPRPHHSHHHHHHNNNNNNHHHHSGSRSQQNSNGSDAAATSSNNNNNNIFNNIINSPAKSPDRASTALVPSHTDCRTLVKSFWARLSSALQDILDPLYIPSKQPQQHLYGRFAALIANDETMQSAVANAVSDAVYQKVLHRLTAMAESASETIHQAFEHSLTHGSDGSVRFFTTSQGLRKAEPHARLSGLVLLGCLLYFRQRLVHCNTHANGKEHDKKNKKENKNNNNNNGHENSNNNNNNNNENETYGCGRAAARLRGERRRLCLREGDAEERFFLDIVSLSEAPNYPNDVPITAAAAATSSTTTTTENLNDADAGNDAVDAACVLLSQSAIQRAFDLFSQKSDFTVQLQLRNIESGKQNLPAWVLPALLLLGWNELWYVVTSPLLMVLLVIVIFVFFKSFVKSQWQVFEECAPAWIVLPAQAGVLHASRALQTVMPTKQINVDESTPLKAQHQDPMEMSSIRADTESPSKELLLSGMRRRNVEKE